MLGRDLQWVLGADYRREAGSLAPDPLHGRANTSSFSVLRCPVSGAYDARELFAAVQVPLLHDRPWARDMALNVGLRWSDFSSFDQSHDLAGGSALAAGRGTDAACQLRRGLSRPKPR